MAWTTDRDRAEWFAKDLRYTSHKDGEVYKVTAMPEAILCDIDATLEDGGRGECEIVVDPSLLGRTMVSS